MDFQPTSKYPLFAPNQVLTDSQLNGLRQFLDEQNRLTRTHGIGAGIVCGLKAEYRYGEDCDEHYVMLSPGYGFSSAGYLIQFDPPSQQEAAEGSATPCADFSLHGHIYTHVRRYDLAAQDFSDLDPEKNIYARWAACPPEVPPQPSGGAKPPSALRLRSVAAPAPAPPAAAAESVLPIWELLTAQQGIQDQKHAVELDEKHLTDYVLVLFFEKGQREEKPCLETDCSRSDETVWHVRPLLVPSACYSGAALCSPLQPLHIHRLFAALKVKDKERELEGMAAIGDYQDINRGYGLIGEKTAGEVMKRLAALYAQYRSFLCLPEDRYFQELAKQFGKYFQSNAFDRDYHQYHYDLLRDLIAGLNEFQAEACKLTGSCWPVEGFPRHLGIVMFRQPRDQQIVGVERGYRTPFYPSPVRNVMHDDWERVQGLFLRLLEMIATYAFPNPLESFTSEAHRSRYPVRITPSQAEDFPLGRRALPYYYRLGSPQEPLAQSWQPAGCCTGELLMGYALQESEMEAEVADAQYAPLHFSLLKHGFLRIEGHIGKPCEEAGNAIRKIRQDYNLEFDLVKVDLHDNPDFFRELPKQYAGMEHMGGVPVGGTFILVCDKVCVEDDGKGNKRFEVVAVADFALNRSVACCEEATTPPPPPPPPQDCPEITAIRYEVRSFNSNGDAEIFYTAVINGTGITAYSWKISYETSPRSTAVNTLTHVHNTLKNGQNFSIALTIQGPPGCTPQTFSQEVIVQEVVINVRSQPAVQPVVVKSRELGASADSALAARAARYYQEIFALNAKGDFAKSAIFQSALDFVQAAPAEELPMEAFRDLSGKILSTYGRSKEGDKKRAYAQMAETLSHKFLDLMAASAAPSPQEQEALAEQLQKFKAAGISLSRIRSNWQPAVLGDSPAIQALNQLLT